MRYALAPYAAFGAVLAAAGLPIYLHAPKVYADHYGVGLASLGAVLFALRLLDVVQEPILGRVAARLGRHRARAVGGALVGLGGGLIGLFAVQAPLLPLIWFALCLTLVFSCFSFLTILFYACGVAQAQMRGGHLALARWREAGALLGVCAAAALPTLLMRAGLPPYGGFAVLFCLAALGAGLAMRHEWQIGRPVQGPVQGPQFRTVWRDHTARRLLLVALLNAAPLAVTSTLFLFFVDSRLEAPGAEGPLLLLYFISGAVAAPLWSRAAERIGEIEVLLFAMGLSIAGFAYVLVLGAGDLLPFALVCVMTGAALGADVTLLPAMFARRLSQIVPEAAGGFALWSLANKAVLALAAAVLLPVLGQAGYHPGRPATVEALTLLTALYAGVPLLLKLAAAGALASLRVEEG